MLFLVTTFAIGFAVLFLVQMALLIFADYRSSRKALVEYLALLLQDVAPGASVVMVKLMLTWKKNRAVSLSFDLIANSKGPNVARVAQELGLKLDSVVHGPKMLDLLGELKSTVVAFWPYADSINEEAPGESIIYLFPETHLAVENRTALPVSGNLWNSLQDIAAESTRLEEIAGLHLEEAIPLSVLAA